jgi:hypothetical protein
VIGSWVGVGEKAIRDWQFADGCPTLRHLVDLAKYYLKVKEEYA